MKWQLFKRKKQLASPLALISRSFKFYWLNKTALIKVIAVVSVPFAVVGVLFGAAEDPVFSAYATIATFVMNMAFLFALGALRQGQTVSLKQAYYEGTARFIQFFLAAFVLALAALPLALGTSIYLVGIGAGLLVTLGEKLLLGALWLVFAMVSVALLARWLFAALIVIEKGNYPVAALSQSFNLTRGKAWPVIGRIVFIGLTALILLVLPVLGVAVLGADQQKWVQVLLQLYGTLVVLPVISTYFYILYEELQ